MRTTVAEQKPSEALRKLDPSLREKKITKTVSQKPSVQIPAWAMKMTDQKNRPRLKLHSTFTLLHSPIRSVLVSGQGTQGAWR